MQKERGIPTLTIVGVARCGTVFPVAVVLGMVVPAAVCR